MDAIKQLLEKKRQAKEALDTRGKKYVKHSTIEEARLKRLREEEDQERLAKVCRGTSPYRSTSPTSSISLECSWDACVTSITAATLCERPCRSSGRGRSLENLLSSCTGLTMCACKRRSCLRRRSSAGSGYWGSPSHCLERCGMVQQYMLAPQWPDTLRKQGASLLPENRSSQQVMSPTAAQRGLQPSPVLRLIPCAQNTSISAGVGGLRGKKCDSCFAALQSDEDRQVRLMKAQEDYQLEDEHRGGHLNNLLELQKEDKAAKLRVGSADPSSKKAVNADSQEVTVDPAAAPEVHPMQSATLCEVP